MIDDILRAARVAFVDIETSGLKPGPHGQILQIGAQVVDPANTNKVLASYNKFIRPSPEAFFRQGTDIEHLRSIGALERFSTLKPHAKSALQEALHPEAQENIELDDKALSKFFPAPGEKSELISLEEARSSFHGFLKENNVEHSIGHNVFNFDDPFLKHHGIEANFKVDTLTHFKNTLPLGDLSASLENIAKYSGTLAHDASETHDALEDTDLLRRTWGVNSTKAGKKATWERIHSIKSGEAAAVRELESNTEKAAPKLGHIFEQFKNGIAGVAKNSMELAERNPLLAIGIGAAAVWGTAKVASPLWRIPAKDDAYNTITGMNEEGTAAQFRKINTDFGSGYRGPVGSVKVHGQTIDPVIQGFRATWYGDFSDPNLERRLREKIKGSGESYDKFKPDEIEAGPTEGTVSVNLHKFNTRWDDADTLLLRRKGVMQAMFAEDIAIRLVGIDSPETTHPNDPTEWFRFRQQQPFGAEATEIAKQVSPHPDRLVMDPNASTYGRYVGLVYNQGDNTSVNQRLVEEGAAAHLPFGEAGSDIYSRKSFQRSEDEAMTHGRGLWADPFFQSYKDVTKGMGGRITFNTLTDLSRLSKNYNLAAAQQMMWSAHQQGDYDPELAAKIGRKLKPSMGRFFKKPNTSAKDDDHNTIEAMNHSGIAHILRRKNTDFGSGFKDATVSTVIHAIVQEAGAVEKGAVKEAIQEAGSQQKSIVKAFVGSEESAERKLIEHISEQNITTTKRFGLDPIEYIDSLDLPAQGSGGEHFQSIINKEMEEAKELRARRGFPTGAGQDMELTAEEIEAHQAMQREGRRGAVIGRRAAVKAERQAIREGKTSSRAGVIPEEGRESLAREMSANKTPNLKKQQMAARQRDANISSSFSGEFGGKGHTTHGGKSK